MRHSAGAPLPECTAPHPLPASKKYVAVQLLTREVLCFIVEAKSKMKELLDQVTCHMTGLGMKDPKLFGLATVSDGEYMFVDDEKKVSKYAPKSWKSSYGNVNGLDSNKRPLLTFYYRVQFYVDSYLLFRDRITRHHYYLQLRENVLTHGQPCPSDTLLFLAAHALQADMGNNVDMSATHAYFSPREYFPAWFLDGKGVDYVVQILPRMHRDYIGLTREEAEMQYIRKASTADAPHNLHLYRLKCRKQELLGSVWLGICATGIEIYEGENQFSKKLVATYLWPTICKLCYERKKFEIRAAYDSEIHKYKYYTSSDEKSEQILDLCRGTHQFSMSIESRMVEVRKREAEERKHIHEPYIYNDQLKWAQEHGEVGMNLQQPTGLVNGGGPSRSDQRTSVVSNTSSNTTSQSDQRISVVSNTSSNTTSGIVSDRVQSMDESEDDLEIEIMINSPPAPVAPSVESLAFAHLRDVPEPYEMLSEIPQPQLSEKKPKKGEDVSISTGLCQKWSGVTTFTAEANGRSGSQLAVANPLHNTSPSSEETIMSRNGSVHSSSSQHSAVSASTVHSRFSLVRTSPQDTETLDIECGGRGKRPSKDVIDLMQNNKGEEMNEDDTVQNDPAVVGESTGLLHSNNYKKCSEGDKSVQSELSNIQPPHCNLCNVSAYASDKCSSNISNCADCDALSVSACNTEDFTEVSVHSDSGIPPCHSDTASEGALSGVQLHHPRQISQSSVVSEGSLVFCVENHNCVNNAESITNAQSYTVSNLEANEENNVPLMTSSFNALGFTVDKDVSTDYSVSDDNYVDFYEAKSSEEYYVDYSVQSGLQNGTVPSNKIDYSVQSAHMSDIPNSGTYPTKCTVSTTFDTDSDYVEVPRNDESYVYLEPLSKPVSMATVVSATPVTAAALKESQCPSLPAEENKNSLPEATFLCQAATATNGISQRTSQPQPPQLEANARFIYTKPHINILTAHTSLATTTSPCFASPTCIKHEAKNVTPVIHPTSLQSEVKTHPPTNPRTKLGTTSLVRGIPSHNYFMNKAGSGLNSGGSGFNSRTNGHSCGLTGESRQFQLVGNGLHHSCDPGAKMKPGYFIEKHHAVGPVIGCNNYLDVHASNTLTRHHNGRPCPPPPPPPPPPPQPPPTTHGNSYLHNQPVRNVVGVQQKHYNYAGDSSYIVNHVPCGPQRVEYVPRQSLATVYTNQVTQSQIEQYKQQLYSNVDYVIYPMKDPAISRQEYIDAKQGSMMAQAHSLASLNVPPPPPYISPKSSVLYRSTPNVSSQGNPTRGGQNFTSLSSRFAENQKHCINCNPSCIISKYASNQSLSSSNYSSLYSSNQNIPGTYSSSCSSHPSLSSKYLSNQSLASSHSSNPSAFSTSTQNLSGSYEPIMVEQIQVRVPKTSDIRSQVKFTRARSDENILSHDTSPRPQQQTSELYHLPPPIYFRKAPEVVSSPPSQQSAADNADSLDIKRLREKSKDLDLPLISALCNDKSLISASSNPTVLPKHPTKDSGRTSVQSVAGNIKNNRPISWHLDTTGLSQSQSNIPSDFTNKAQSVWQEQLHPNGVKADPTPTAFRGSVPHSRVVTDHSNRSHFRKQSAIVEHKINKSNNLTSLSSFSKSKHSYSVSPSIKYPVSGLSTIQMNKHNVNQRKLPNSSHSHTHPHSPAEVNPGTVFDNLTGKELQMNFGGLP